MENILEDMHLEKIKDLGLIIEEKYFDNLFMNLKKLADTKKDIKQRYKKLLFFKKFM